MVVYVKIEGAAEIFKGLTIFNYWEKFGVDEKFWLKLQRAGKAFFDSKGDAFMNPNNHVCPLAPFSKTV